MPREEVLKHRPESPEQVMTNARMVVSNIMKGLSPDEDSISGDPEGDADNSSAGK